MGFLVLFCPILFSINFFIKRKILKLDDVSLYAKKLAIFKNICSLNIIHNISFILTCIEFLLFGKLTILFILLELFLIVIYFKTYKLEPKFKNIFFKIVSFLFFILTSFISLYFFYKVFLLLYILLGNL